jgi:hypothetical protein
MHLTDRETWAILHGMVFGALFLLAFAGGFAGLWSLRPELLTEQGVEERIRRLAIGTWVMAGVAWMAVLSGTWMIYPWYMESGGVARQLLADPARSAWQTLGMEWKQHIAWFSPILATATAIIIGNQRQALATRPSLRRALMVMLTASFACAAIAGLFGALITRVAPVR